MNICVCVKQVPDVQASIQTGRMVLNAYDASAVEEALVMNSGSDGVVDLVLIGPQTAAETLRKALAMGAANATHIVVDKEVELDSHAISRMLARHFEGHEYDVILAGKQSQDTDSGLVGSMLAELLELPYAANAVGMKMGGESILVTRQGDSGQEIIELSMPCLVTCSNDMNNPRIPSLKGIMGAKRKQITFTEMTPGEIRSRISSVYEPAARESGIKMEGEPEEIVALLISKLENEAGVL